MSRKGKKEIKLNGISGSPGICIGKAYLVDKEGVNVIEKYYIREENLPNEINRFKGAVKRAKDELATIIEEIPEELKHHVDILEAQLVMHKDKMLYGRTIETIDNELVNAEWALKKVVSDIKTMFQGISDPYLQSRVSDIINVSDRIMRNLVGAENVNIAEIDRRVILVANDLSPADTSQIKLDRIKGFVTDCGGKASHTGIIARSLEIPSVLGLDTATSHINNDDIVIVDGSSGAIIINPTDETILKYESLAKKYAEYKEAVAKSSHLPAETVDGIRLAVMGNIEMPEEALTVISNGGDGIGLFRTEFLYMSRNNFPTEEELFEQYKMVVETMAPKTVTIRTLDINGDKALPYSPDQDEANPALGLRAIRFCLGKPEVFTTQLRAILRAAAFGHVRLMFPMISGVEEIISAKKILDKAADSLEKDGLQYNRDIEIGIMIEVPSAVILADLMAKEVDFFSIGTNDLVQYSLAIDRGNRQVAYLFQPLHPAVLRMLMHVVKVGREQDINVFMCGEMASDPINLPVLLGIGMEELSMNPQSIPTVKNMIKKLSINDSKALLQEILKQENTQTTIQIIENAYGSVISAMSYAKS